MTQCAQCRHDIVTVQCGGTTVILDAHAKTYRGTVEAHLYPEEGDVVFLSSALVEHSAVCAAVREGEARSRRAHAQRRAS
jgi:hypothetical protein